MKSKQATNKRRSNQFAPGNKIGQRFQPGQSGNPNGRPKRTRLTEALRGQLAELGDDEETIAERVARALISQALAGNVQAIREIGDRTEGKPRQALDVDLSVFNWQELARAHGLNLDDIVSEARKLIESAVASGSADSDSKEDGG